jgi:hypothetical protein
MLRLSRGLFVILVIGASYVGVKGSSITLGHVNHARA